MLKKWSVVNALKIVFILAFTVMLVTEGITLYQYIDRNVIQVNKEIDLLKEASVGDRVYFGEWELDYEKGEMEYDSWEKWDEYCQSGDKSGRNNRRYVCQSF